MTPLEKDAGGRPRLAILLGAPMNRQNFERIGIPYLSPHFDIVVLDFKPWLGRDDSHRGHEQASWHAIEAIASAGEFEAALRRHRPHYALDFVGLGLLTPEIQRVLAACGTRFVVQKSGNLPLPSVWAKLRWKLRVHNRGAVPAAAPGTAAAPQPSGAPARGRISRLLAAPRARVAMRCRLLAPDIALLAGYASLNYFTRRSREIVWVGSQDYHRFRQAPAPDGEGVLPTAAFIVFVDDNVPYASDWSLLGLPPPVTPDVYYDAMRAFFARIEAAWRMPVVIAAHPSSRHDERVARGFGGRPVIHDRTAELVRSASAVMLHGSTAISFAVMSGKPVLFITSDELRYSRYGLHIDTMAAEFGQMPLVANDSAAVPPLPSLEPRAEVYQRYMEQYLFCGDTVESGPWDAFIRYATGRVETPHVV